MTVSLRLCSLEGKEVGVGLSEVWNGSGSVGDGKGSVVQGGSSSRNQGVHVWKGKGDITSAEGKELPQLLVGRKGRRGNRCR